MGALSPHAGSARLAILDRRAGRSLVDSLCEQGLRVIWDGSAGGRAPALRGFGNRGASSPGRSGALPGRADGAPPSGGRPGALLRACLRSCAAPWTSWAIPAPAARTLERFAPAASERWTTRRMPIASLPDASGPRHHSPEPIRIGRPGRSPGAPGRASRHRAARPRRRRRASGAPHPGNAPMVSAPSIRALLLFNHADRAREAQRSSAVTISGSGARGMRSGAGFKAMLVVGAGGDPRRRA